MVNAMRCLPLLTDSYKFSHAPQYPPGTQFVRSHFVSRGGLFPETVQFGLQPMLIDVLSQRVTHEDVDLAKEICDLHMGPGMFNEEGWRYIVDHHQGRLPVRIKAAPEGSVIGVHNVLMTVENTDPKCFWLTNYLETILSHVWYPMTVATLSRAMKKLILGYLKETGDPSLIDFKLHDFGFRGVSSIESAAIGGAAHLVNFKGTDTVVALLLLRRIYGEKMAGFSIPASEHSTITSWGRDDEFKAFKNMIKTYGSNFAYACVSDSFDVYGACAKGWGEELKADVEGAGGTLVVRPDSGVPHEVVVKCLDILGEKFGYTINNVGVGYKVLNPKVRLIQGDGIDFEETRKILEAMKRAGWSADNVTFGMGGGLLQKVNRDTQKCAFKCNSVMVNGVERDVYKSPITDPGKKSMRGQLYLTKNDKGEYVTKVGTSEKDLLELVFENGEVKKTWTLAEIRARAAVG